MNSVRYKILGRPWAGSLIAEFLFHEIGVNYDIFFVDSNDLTNNDIKSEHPQGKIPTLICSDGNTIYETLAIVNHITDRFNALVPKRRTFRHDRYWQFLSLMATSIYPAYHRQHHSQYYISEGSYEDLSRKAREEQSKIYDYIENELNPYICGDLLTAADFYLYMLVRWDLYKDALYHSRPQLKNLTNIMRARPSIAGVLNNQRKRKIEV